MVYNFIYSGLVAKMDAIALLRQNTLMKIRWRWGW